LFSGFDTNAAAFRGEDNLRRYEMPVLTQFCGAGQTQLLHHVVPRLQNPEMRERIFEKMRPWCDPPAWFEEVQKKIAAEAPTMRTTVVECGDNGQRDFAEGSFFSRQNVGFPTAARARFRNGVARGADPRPGFSRL
jgi:hypothetical protein